MNIADKKINRFRIAVALAMVSLILTGTVVTAEESDTNKKQSSDIVSNQSVTDDSNSYFSYFSKYEKYDRIADQITLKAETAVVSGAAFNESDGIKSLRFENDGQFAEWNFEVAHEGCYAIQLQYYNVAGKNSNISTAIKIDGESPFYELDAIELPRYWQDERDDNDNFYKDIHDNDKLPEQHEVFKWESLWLYDTQGMYDEPYEVYLTEGSHSLRIGYVDGAFILGKITLGQEAETISYKEYLDSNSSNASKKADDSIIIEAEKPTFKSSLNLYPQGDRTNAATQPNRAGYSCLNYIGGANWCYTGQSLVYEFDVSKDGWYVVSVKARQNTNQGMNSYRMLSIDGKAPFKEAEKMEFPYNLKWNVYTLGNGKYKIYLAEGKHTLELKCVPSKMFSALRRLNQAVLNLNSIYREIIMVTGTSPDVYQDYNLDTVIPDLKDRFADLSKELYEISDEIANITGTHDTQASILDETAIMLEKMRKSPYTIPLRLSSYKGNVESLGSLLYTLGQQPLSVDYIEFTPIDKKPGNGKTNFLQNISFNITAFITSFTQDYNSVSDNSGKSEKTLNVWVSSGRDQVKIVNDLINDRFIPNSDVSVNLSLVDTGTTLIQATLAGKGPDLALMVPQDTPVNLASRGALVDLSKYDLSVIEAEIGAEAFIPFRYEGGLYGLPETETFYMLFYRTDIFKELNLNVPNTWDEFYQVLNVLEANNLRVGIPEINAANKGVSSGIMTLEMLIYQNGGSLYTPDLKKTALDTEIANRAFEEYTKFYTHYGLEQDYSFFNRMRSGEMAMAFEYYSAYNQLTVAAPELNGLWSFAPVPGTVDENGNINRTVIGSVSGCIVLKAAEKKGVVNEAVKFLKWWVSAETQARYANLLESTMGLMGRYTPANRKAFEQMNWSASDAAIIMSQWQSVTLIPEIPGGYYVNRSLTSALRSVITNKNSARRELSLFNRDINNEITRKRKEFGLD